MVDDSSQQNEMQDNQNDSQAESHYLPNEGSYQLYLQNFNANPSFFNNKILSYDEFLELAKLDKDTKTKLGFIVPGLSPMNVIGGLNTAANLIDSATTGVRAAQVTAEQLRSSVSRMKATTDKFMDVASGPGDSGSGGGGSYSNETGGPISHFDVRRLNMNVKPVEVRLNTGIVPNTYGPYYQDATSLYSPLHLTQTKVSFLNLASGDNLDVFYTNVLSFVFQNLAQMNVAFNLNADTNLSSTNLKNYFDALSIALQYYYFYASIISYCDNPANRNQGMLALRAMMTADDLENLYQLKRILEGTPIPPNLNHFLFYLMQTYKQSSLPGSPLMKIMPMKFATTTDVNNKFTALPGGYISNAITNLISGQNRLTGSLIARVCPGWLAEDLAAPVNVPLHDLQFNTIFGNLHGVFCDSTGAAVRTPSVASNIANAVYNAHTDELDGAVFGMTTMYNSSTATWAPGIMDYTVSSTYATTKYTNRLSYYPAVDGVSSFLPVAFDYNVTMDRAESYVTLGTAIFSYHRFGTEPALNVNINSVRETAYKFFEWLLSLNSVGSGAKALKSREVSKITHVNDMKGSGSSKGSKSRGKPKRKVRSKSKNWSKDEITASMEGM